MTNDAPRRPPFAAPQWLPSRWLAILHPWLEARPPDSPPACGDHVWIVANPHAGGHQTDLEAASAYLRRVVPRVELRWTAARGEAAQIAREALRAGATTVVAAGGDGTMNEVAQALVGTDVALGVIPIGTVNVWAREMGIPLAPIRAAQALLSGERHVIDVGRVNGRVFVLMVGIGLDGEAAHVIERARVGGLRKLVRYVPLVISLALRYRGTRVAMRLDGRQRTVRPLMIVISNTRLYGGAFTFNPDAEIDDGLLDMCVIEDQNIAQRAVVFVRALARRATTKQRVVYERFEHASIRASRKLYVQIDGEMFGALPVTVEAVPHALVVIVPAQRPLGASLHPDRSAVSGR